MKLKECLGIDIGGTSAKYAIINEHGEMRCKGYFPTGAEMTRDAFMEQLYRICDNSMREGISGIGICSLGIVNRDTDEIIGAVENLPLLLGINFRELLQHRYPGLPVAIYNDGKAAALGERWMGAAKNTRNFCCIIFGTGLGGALFLDSEVVEGAHFRAGELGYIDYTESERYLERDISTIYMLRQAAERLGKDSIDGFEFFWLVREKNPVCEALFYGWLDQVARLVANLFIMLDVEKVIIGGGISTERDLILTPLVDKVKTLVPEQFREDICIVMAECCNSAGMYGSVSGFFGQDNLPA